MAALPEPGIVQVWSGLLARTQKDWSLLVRAPANLPRTGYDLFEGIVETDRWFGPLFTNIRFTRSHAPIRLRPDFPLAQVQPLPRVAYAEANLAPSHVTADMAGLSADDWEAYRTAIAGPSDDPERRFGRYAVTARKRARASCPIEPESKSARH